MLDWLEEICVGIDISPPLEDRHEPRYRSLPRQPQRQRQIEAAAQGGSEEDFQLLQEAQIIAEQEGLFSGLYPNLAGGRPFGQLNGRLRDSLEIDNSGCDHAGVIGEVIINASEHEQLQRHALGESERASRVVLEAESSYDPKTAPARVNMSYNALCWFRRRCAPILLGSSARSSAILFKDGRRLQIDPRRKRLLPFEPQPPRYDAVFGITANAPISQLPHV
jgi:hypothetical protein